MRCHQRRIASHGKGNSWQEGVHCQGYGTGVCKRPLLLGQTSRYCEDARITFPVKASHMWIGRSLVEVTNPQLAGTGQRCEFLCPQQFLSYSLCGILHRLESRGANWIPYTIHTHTHHTDTQTHRHTGTHTHTHHTDRHTGTHKHTHTHTHTHTYSHKHTHTHRDTHTHTYKRGER